MGFFHRQIDTWRDTRKLRNYSGEAASEIMACRHKIERTRIENRTLREEVKRLQAIVDKLPKCWRLNEAGELVQDVPVVPGMILYNGTYEFVVSDRHIPTADFNWYSTREAAEAGGEL